VLRKLLVAFALLAVAGGGGCYLFVTKLMDAGDRQLRELFQDLAAAPAEQVLDRFVPAAREKNDPERLVAFARAIPETFGEYREIPFFQGQLNMRSGTGGDILSYQGTLEFAEGPRQLKVVLVDGKVDTLRVLDPAQSKEIEATMSRPPEDPSYARDRARTFLEAWVAGDRDAAFAQLLPELREELGKQGLDRRREELGLAGASGPVAHVEDVDAGRPDAQGVRLRVGGAPSEVDVLVGFRGFQVGVLAMRSAS